MINWYLFKYYRGANIFLGIYTGTDLGGGLESKIFIYFLLLYILFL